MGWRFAGTSWAFRPTTSDTKYMMSMATEWVAGHPPKTADLAARAEVKRGGLQSPGHVVRPDITV